MQNSTRLILNILNIEEEEEKKTNKYILKQQWNAGVKVINKTGKM